MKASRTPGGHYRISQKDLGSFVIEKGMYPLADNHSSDKKILIVDDDPGAQKLMARILFDEKFETETASSGYEAGIKVARFKPGLIVLDLFMPEMTGFEVCRRIKEDPETAHIKILAVTGYDNPENKGLIMTAGADDYLAKPIEKDVPLRHVKTLFRSTVMEKIRINN